jgi:UDP-2,3-diacylglucosamine pyrophosphatase LpxH
MRCASPEVPLGRSGLWLPELERHRLHSVPARSRRVTRLQQNPCLVRRMSTQWDEAMGGRGAPERVRALFISDVHLGTRAAQTERLLEFLRRYEADTIYLVGDIVDFWRVRRGPYWPQSHNDVLQKLLRQVRKGVRLVLVPGNHDDGLRDYAGLRFGGIEIHKDTVHLTAKGRRYFVMHGDEFDVVVRTARWLALLGDHGYEFALWLNHPLNWARRHLGLGYWSLSAYLKYRVKRAVAFIGAFEEAVAAETRRRDLDGVICGHIHHASDRRFGGIHYLNCGDWVESCTAIIETYAGELRVVHWPQATPTPTPSFESAPIADPVPSLAAS